MGSTLEPTVQRSAEALGRALAQTEAFQAWQRAKEAVQAHEAARIMWEDLQRRIAQLEAKTRNGQEASEDERRQIDELIKLAGYNPYVRALLLAQEELVAMVLTAHQAVDQALGLVPAETPAVDAGAAATASGPRSSPSPSPSSPSSASSQPSPLSQHSAPDVTVAKSKLWIPGQP